MPENESSSKSSSKNFLHPRPRVKEEFFSHPQSISIKILDIHAEPLERIEIKNVPSDIDLNDVLTYLDGKPYEVKLRAAGAAAKRAHYVRRFCEWVIDWIEKSLNSFGVPNSENFITMPYSLQHLELNDNTLDMIKSVDYDTIFSILPESLQVDNPNCVNWTTKILSALWSLNTAKALWVAIGRVCLARQYIGEERHAKIFSDTTWGNAIRNGLLYFNQFGDPLPTSTLEKSNDIWFIAPKFEFPIVTVETVEEEEVPSEIQEESPEEAVIKSE